MNRRKQIKNNLMKSPILRNDEKEIILEALKRSDIPPDIRGEKLDIETIIRFVDEIYKLTK